MVLLKDIYFKSEYNNYGNLEGNRVKPHSDSRRIISNNMNSEVIAYIGDDLARIIIIKGKKLNFAIAIISTDLLYFAYAGIYAHRIYIKDAFNLINNTQENKHIILKDEWDKLNKLFILESLKESD